MNRRLVIVFLGMALIGAGTAAWFLGLRTQRPEELAQVAASPRLSPPLGVNVALQQVDEDRRSAVIDTIAEAGFGWVRQRFPWNEIEPAPGTYNWASWDSIVRDVSERGLGLMAVLDGTPEWARAAADADNPLAPPHQRDDLGRFASAFAQRYRDQVHYYQVWDEPNIAPHWGAGPVDATDYAGLLREAAIQLRATDPDAVIVAAALAPNVEAGGTNQSDVTYLDALYQAGAAPWFDIAAAQPYGFERPPQDPPSPELLNFSRARLLHRVMQQNGDGDTPLWLVAYGWHAPLVGDPSGDSPWGSVDAEMQARWASEASDLAWRQWPWAGALAWAWWQPPYAPEDPHWGFALVDPAGEPRPVLSELTNWILGTPPLGIGVWTLAEPALQEEGGWRLTAQGADPPHGAMLQNNRLVIPFDGTELALQIQRGPYWAFLDVTVDGEPANALPKDDHGRANLVLYDPLAGQGRVTVADNLPDGVHVAEVAASGGWQQWPLLAIVVKGEEAGDWPDWLAWALGLAGVVLLVIGVRSRPSPSVSTDAVPYLARAGQALEYRGSAAYRWRYGWLVLGVLMSILLPSNLRPVGLLLLLGLFLVLPEMSLPLLAALAPLYLVSWPLVGRSFNPAEVVTWLAAAGAAIHMSMIALGRTTRGWFRSPLASLQPLDWGVLGLLVVSALSLTSALNPGVALHEFRQVIVTGVIAYGLVRVMPSIGRQDAVDPWPLVWGIGTGAVIVALWGVFQATAGVGLITAEGVQRVRGPFGSPNNLALYLGHTLPVLLAVAALATDRRRRLIAALIGLPIAVALLLTFSKGALLLGMPAALLFLGFAAGGRWRWIMLGALVLLALALLPLFGTERFSGLFNLESGTSFLRLQLWRGALNMALDHPWLGVGLDNFLYAYRTTYVTPQAWQELNLSHPHNVLLDFWTRLGIAGVVVGLWLFVSAFLQGWRARREVQGDLQALMLGLLASLVATLAHGLIDNSVFLMDLMLLFMLTLGLIARLSGRPNESTPPGRQLPGPT